MIRKTSTLMKDQKIKAVACDVKTPFSDPFYMVTVEGKPVGRPVDYKEAMLIVDWFNTVIFEYDNSSSNKDVY
jgi:hypothetical protein